MPRREYRGAAAPLTLSADITAGTLSFSCDGDTTGWPTGSSAKFYIEIDRGVAGKAEKLLVTTRSAGVFTIGGAGDRGADDTTATTHAQGAIVEHVLDSDSMDEANAHVNDDARDDHSQYLNTARHDLTTRHLLGTSVPAAVPGNSALADTASEGVSTSAARADHRHGRESFGSVGSISAEAIGDTSAAGSSSSPARVDHRHAMPGFGAPVASAPGDTASNGVATTVAHSDHRHQRETAPFYPNLLERKTQDFSDQSVAISGNDIIMSDTFTVGAGGRLMLMSFTCQNRRNSGAGLNFAGNVICQVDGVTTGAPDRLSSQTKDVILKGSLFVAAVLSAGLHTVTIKGSCDPSSDVGMYYFNRAMSVNLIGG